LQYPELVGKGSFKVVYKGQHLEHGHLVAWNEISIKNINHKELKRILTEMTLLKTLAHPNLITVRDSERMKGRTRPRS
jgi:serine/threonine protein kinase